MNEPIGGTWRMLRSSHEWKKTAAWAAQFTCRSRPRDGGAEVSRPGNLLTRGLRVRVVIFGATGMVGMGTLIECLEDPPIDSVLVVGRRTVGMHHAKLEEIIHDDFFHYEPIQGRFAGVDACFFCLGVSSAGMPAETYYHLTYDLTLAAARSMVARSPEMTFCYVSGEGTDSSEHGRMRWARVKGKTENELLRLLFKAVYMLRPGYIQPLKGVKSKTPLYQGVYVVLGWLYSSCMRCCHAIRRPPLRWDGR